MAVGCSTCLRGKGQIFFYDAQNLNLTYTLEGDNNYRQVGSNIMYRPNTGFSEQFWYTSYKSGKVTLHSIVFFKFTANEHWEHKKDSKLLEIDLNALYLNEYAASDRYKEDSSNGHLVKDELLFGAYKDSFIYKMKRGVDLRTFLSCEYNRWYFTENEDNNDDRRIP